MVLIHVQFRDNFSGAGKQKSAASLNATALHATKARGGSNKRGRSPHKGSAFRSPVNLVVSPKGPLERRSQASWALFRLFAHLPGGDFAQNVAAHPRHVERNINSHFAQRPNTAGDVQLPAMDLRRPFTQLR